MGREAASRLDFRGRAVRRFAPHGSSSRELRPRAGRSPWRPLYRQLGNRLVILTVGPEAQVDSRGFDDAVGRAQTRFGALEH